MIPLAQPSPQPKGHLDRFSRFRKAHDRRQTLVADFKEAHFLLVDGGRRIVMTDLDDVTSAEPACTGAPVTAGNGSRPHVTSFSCPYGLQVHASSFSTST